MGKVEIILPKMGESVAEATVTSWLKEVGDLIEVEDALLEIATDKVDSEVPSPVSGKLAKIFFLASYSFYYLLLLVIKKKKVYL